MSDQFNIVTDNEKKALEILRNIQDAQSIETTREILKAMRPLIAFGLMNANDPAVYPCYDHVYRVFHLLDKLENLLSLPILEMAKKEASNGQAKT